MSSRDPGEPLRILFVTSEALPWIKTGGLGDVGGSLPRALAALGHDVKLLIPAYADVLSKHPELKPLSGFRSPLEHAGLLAGPRTPEGVEQWLLTLPGFSDRPGLPYQDEQGHAWPDNWWRFGALSRVAAALAGGRAGLDWQADVLHCNDWQTGLAPVYCQRERVPAATIFTIHNLHYRGLFPGEHFRELALPAHLWNPEALEFHNQLAFIKGGLAFADELTTVSPTYAQEICTPDRGEGLDGLLRARRAHLTGILNGIDTQRWDPARDRELPAHFDRHDLSGKARCKASLQREMLLEPDPEAPVLAVVSRLVAQKGMDLIIANAQALLDRGCQLVVLGTGEPEIEAELQRVATSHPGRVGLCLDFKEGLAHRIEAGADIFLMPSRFEPCGLNQLYSQRYGTPPVVHQCGGLADSVVDADNQAGEPGTGFVFQSPTPDALRATLERALAWFRDPPAWKQLQLAGMARDFSWSRSARAYLDIYDRALARFRAPREPDGFD